MQYRTLGRSGLKVSAIGLGTEYLLEPPREHVVEVIHEAIALGINYFDLFYAQPDFRDTMGVAFKESRNQVYLAAHLGASYQDGQYERTRDLGLSEQLFHDFLTRYQTDYVDVLFLHNSDGQEDYDELMAPGGFLDLAHRLQQDGKVRSLGFSGHTIPTALQAVESDQIDVLMFPISLAGNAVPGKRDLLNACVKHDVGLIAMKPYAGGKLLQQEHRISTEHWQTGGAPVQIEKSIPITPVQCLAYVLSQVGVSMVVPGCKNLKELAAAMAYWDAPPDERDFSEIVTDFDQYVTGECVYCNHCLPCPAGLDIGETIRLYEMAYQHLTKELQTRYDALPANASHCLQCGDCMERCPFEVDVISKMEQAELLF